VTAVFDWLTADPYRAGTLAALLVIAALPAILLLATAPGTHRRHQRTDTPRSIP
jgi:hypothetical protein